MEITSLQALIWPLFLLLAALLAWLCRRQLLNPRCHGFYRFYAFTGILWLLLNALPLWHHQVLSLRQAVSFCLMIAALAMLISGFLALRRFGGADARRQADENFSFENTAHLVSRGIFAYVRHPMYSALLLLNWGLLLKRLDADAIAVALLVTLALYLTARTEERENADYFGPAYPDYVRRSKCFLPLIW